MCNMARVRWIGRAFMVAFCVGAPIAQGQVRCEMQNGKTIELQLSPKCPSGAVSGTTLDGVPIEVEPKRAPVVPPTRAPKQPPAPLQPPGALPQAPEPPARASHASSEVDEAYLLCKIFRANGASECDVDIGFFSANKINATIAIGPLEARRFCSELTDPIRNNFRAIRSSERGWQLQIFSPYGAGKRPIAVCDL